MKNQGMSGTDRAEDERHERRDGRLPRVPGLPRPKPQLLARVNLEGDLGVLHQRLRDAARIGLLDTALAVDGRKLAGLGLRVTLDLAALDLELALQQLRLR